MHIYTMECYSALKRRKLATTWLVLEDIKLHEIRQTEKGRHYTVSLYVRK